MSWDGLDDWRQVREKLEAHRRAREDIVHRVVPAAAAARAAAAAPAGRPAAGDDGVQAPDVAR